MKLSPTLPLALALSAGIATAALAQTTASPTPSTGTPPSTAYSQPGSAQPQANTGQTALDQRQPTANPGQAAAKPGSDPQIMQAQQQLHAAGLYNGPTDGIMDPDTRAAIERYQQQHGLQRTGTLDQTTLANLGSGTSSVGSSTPAATSTTTPTATTPGTMPGTTPAMPNAAAGANAKPAGR